MRQNLNGRVEQRDATDPLRMRARELEQQPAAERMPDPVRLDDSECVDGLDEIRDMRLERPRRFVSRAAVPAQIGRHHVKATRPPFRCEPAIALAMSGHAVQAYERRSGPVAPLVHVKLHGATRTLRRFRTAGSTSCP